MNKLKKFAINGAIMTLSAILLRTAAVGFNIYIAKVAGAEAIGLYSLLSNIFAFAVTLALSGLHLSATRLISEALALNDKKEVGKILRRCIFYALCFGFLSSILLLTLSKTISSVWLGENRILKPLYILSICLPIMSVSSVINGYFSAVRRVYKTSISSLSDLTVRILSTAFLFTVVNEKNAESACILLVCGNVLSEFFSFTINLILYIFDRVKHFKKSENIVVCKSNNLSKQILSISLPIAFTSYVRSALVAIEHSLIPLGLCKYGLNKNSALASYGTLASMALPVINFPYALIGSFSSLLIPEVAECRARQEKGHLKYIAYRTYQTGIAFSICIFGAFYTFSSELGNTLYDSTAAGTYIKCLSALVPIMYTDSITDAILKGCGEQFYSMKVNIFDASLSVVLVYFLVPIYGIEGYIATIFIAEIINASLSIIKMLKVTKLHPPFIKFIVLPLLCTAGSASVSNILSKMLFKSKSIYSLIPMMSIYIMVYIMFLFFTSCISNEDILWIKSVFSKSQKKQQ